MPTATGKVTQVIGSTFDAEFPEDQLPKIYNALKIAHTENGTTLNLTGEVASHLGGGKIRAVALGSTSRVTVVRRCSAPRRAPHAERVWRPALRLRSYRLTSFLSTPPAAVRRRARRCARGARRSRRGAAP